MFGRKPQAPVTIDDLPSWAVAGPESLEEHPIPNKITSEFKPSTEINSKITLWMRGNSARLAADAIVNAANSSLYPGGGICGVIHSAAGPKLADACAKIGHTPTGQAALTPGFDLPAKYVIHAVGPVGEKPAELESAYKSTLAYMDGEKIRSIGFCCISTGIYGYPIEPATHVALNTVRQWLEVPENREKTDRIIFVVFEPRDVKVYYKLIHKYFPLEDAETPNVEETEKKDGENQPKDAEAGEEKEADKPKEEAPKKAES